MVPERASRPLSRGLPWGVRGAQVQLGGPASRLLNIAIMSFREKLAALLAPPGKGEAPTCLSRTRSALVHGGRVTVAHLRANRYPWICVLCFVLLMYLRDVVPEWLYLQLKVLPAVVVPPIDGNQASDVNYWGGQFMGVGVLTTATVAVTSSREWWEDKLLRYLFLERWQRALFKQFLLSALQAEVAIFLARQVSMLGSRMFVPDPWLVWEQGPKDSDLDPLSWASMRHSVDMALRMAFYIFTGLVWTGVRARLFGVPLRRQTLLRRLTHTLHFAGVAAMRIYPAWSYAGVDITTGLVTLFRDFPVTAIVFGAASILPGHFMGEFVKRYVRGNIWRVGIIYLSQVILVSWTTHAGRALAYEIAETSGGVVAVPDVIASIGRMSIVFCFSTVVFYYCMAGSLLYGSSPLFQCVWDDVQYKGTELTDDAQVKEHIMGFVDGVHTALQKIFTSRPSRSRTSAARSAAREDRGAAGPPPPLPGEFGADGTGDSAEPTDAYDAVLDFGTSVLGTIEQCRNLITMPVGADRRSGGRVRLRVYLTALVTNESTTTFTMPPMRIELTTEHGHKWIGRPSRPPPLIVLEVGRITVKGKTHEHDDGRRKAHFVVHMSIGMSALSMLASGDLPLRTVDVALYAPTGMFGFDFAAPLLQYQNGQWRGILERRRVSFNDVFDKAALVERARLGLQRANDALRQGFFRGAPAQMQRNLGRLNATINRLDSRDPLRPPDLALLLDLVSAGYHILSVFKIERKIEADRNRALSMGEAPHDPLAPVRDRVGKNPARAVLEQTAVLLTHQFYGVASYYLGSGHDPSHVLLLTVMLSLAQGVLSPGHGVRLAENLIRAPGAFTGDDENDPFSGVVAGREAADSGVRRRRGNGGDGADGNDPGSGGGAAAAGSHEAHGIRRGPDSPVHGQPGRASSGDAQAAAGVPFDAGVGSARHERPSVSIGSADFDPRDGSSRAALYASSVDGGSAGIGSRGSIGDSTAASERSQRRSVYSSFDGSEGTFSSAPGTGRASEFEFGGASGFGSASGYGDAGFGGGSYGDGAGGEPGSALPAVAVDPYLPSAAAHREPAAGVNAHAGREGDGMFPPEPPTTGLGRSGGSQAPPLPRSAPLQRAERSGNPGSH